MTMVRICTSPNTSKAAAKPVSIPAAKGSVSQNTRPLRNTHSSSANVSPSPTALISRLSFSAAAFDTAANSAPPAVSVSVPLSAAIRRLCAISGRSASLPEKLSPPASRPRRNTHVLPLSSANNIPLSMSHCKRLCGFALPAANRPKPSQSCSSGKGEGAANGLAAASARA